MVRTSDRTCECANLPETINLESSEARFADDLSTVNKKTWLTLAKCGACGQLWQLDLIDKLQTNLAIKVPTDIDWASFDDKPLRTNHLIRSRGGISDKPCIVQACQNLAINSLAYCPHHAFDYADLRE